MAKEEIEEVKTEEGKKRKKLGLTSKILIAMVLGIIVGLLFQYAVPEGYVRDDVFIGGIFYVIGNGFLRLMQMLVVPLVFCSIVCGASSIGNTKELGVVGVKTIVFYLCTTALAIAVALTIGNIISPGLGVNASSLATDSASLDKITASEQTSLADTLLAMIPKNPIASLANGDMLPVIVFALFVGVMIALLGRRVETVNKVFNQFNDVMLRMTTAVMSLAPYGVFCLLAKSFSTMGIDMFLPLIKYMLGVVGALFIQCFVVYMLLFFIFTRQNPLTFIKKFYSVMLFAFSTATSTATIPLNIETLEQKMGVDRKISSFTIPLGATINMDGTAIMQGVAVVFTAQLFGVDLGFTGYLTVILTATIASVGTAGVPSAGLITLSMVFNSVGLPLEGISYIMGIDRILDMLRTAVNITGDAVVTTIIAKQEKCFDVEKFKDPEAGSQLDAGDYSSDTEE